MCSANSRVSIFQSTTIQQISQALESGGFLRKTAGDEDFDAAVNAIANAIDNDMGLIVSGEYGCGKTKLINVVTADIANSDMLHKVKLGIPGNETRLSLWHFEDVAIDPYKMSIYLDDLGAEKQANDYGVVSEQVSEFISGWHEYGHWHYVKGRPLQRLFITTNLTTEEIDKRYGGRMFSRLKDLCVPLRLKGADKRKWIL